MNFDELAPAAIAELLDDANGAPINDDDFPDLAELILTEKIGSHPSDEDRIALTDAMTRYCDNNDISH